MALENEENVESGFNDISETKPKKDWVLLSLRVVAFLATISATLVMALNKQTISVLVATIGSTPITATLNANFQHTPSFVFFVIANGIVSLYNLVMIAVDILGPHFDNKGLQLALVAIFDMVILGLATAGDSAATSMAELGRNGNSHARWAKLCDKFEVYCNRGAAALIVSFISLILLLIVAVISITKLLKLNRI